MEGKLNEDVGNYLELISATFNATVVDKNRGFQLLILTAGCGRKTFATMFLTVLKVFLALFSNIN